VYSDAAIAPGEQVHTFEKTPEWPLVIQKNAKDDAFVKVNLFEGVMFDTQFEVTLLGQEELAETELDFIILAEI